MIGFIKFTAALVWWYLKGLLIMSAVVMVIFAVAFLVWYALDRRRTYKRRQAQNAVRRDESGAKRR